MHGTADSIGAIWLARGAFAAQSLPTVGYDWLIHPRAEGCAAALGSVQGRAARAERRRVVTAAATTKGVLHENPSRSCLEGGRAADD